MLDRLFRLQEKGTSVTQEAIGGLTTFMTMAYIIFVQPAVLSAAGMDFGSVMVATCLSSAVATFLMAFLANYPIALAPAMGHNFFFVYTICLAMGVPWQTALGANFISGAAFIILAIFGLREMLVNAIPESLKQAIAVGIGLFIALIGFQWAGIVVYTPGTVLGLGDLHSPPVLLALFGLFLITILYTLRVKGAIVLGILVTALVGVPAGIVTYHGVVSAPPSVAPTFFRLNVGAALTLSLLPTIFILFFLDLFDTVGTLIGVSQQAGFMREGKLPGARKALLSDAIGTLFGTIMGTSTVTSYIESSTGVASGARTGLANIITGLLFLIALFFFPLVKMIGGGYVVNSSTLYPITAPALILVGTLMMGGVAKIKWRDATEAIPAFLTIVIMPYAYSITEGIAVGFIFYSLLKLVTGKIREVHPILLVFTILFILRYIFLV
ncbi:guanine permease [candidate division WOR_3 bacterium SM23_60]|uniref:Guanine permease n=1 Tax=candidate division WOR_3 bacterium SM23_60 TaxID=1703780 RepID=A0A0S8GDC4_UNCW3|nr:MAG: guanine permease [candidate division WOR_3 bacterium SM23_60]